MKIVTRAKGINGVLYSTAESGYAVLTSEGRIILKDVIIAQNNGEESLEHLAQHGPTLENTRFGVFPFVYAELEGPAIECTGIACLEWEGNVKEDLWKGGR